MATIARPNEPLAGEASSSSIFSAEKKRRALARKEKSLAYTLTYRDKNRTLTNDEITVVHARIRERLQERIGRGTAGIVL